MKKGLYVSPELINNKSHTILSHLTKRVKELFRDLKGRGQKWSLRTLELNQFGKVDKGVRNQTIRFITEEAALEKVGLTCYLHRASCAPSRL